MERVRIIDGCNERRQRRDGLLENVLPELGNVRADVARPPTYGHCLRSECSRALNVNNAPVDGRCDIHDDVVGTRGLDSLEIIRLNLYRHKLFELPVLVIKEVHGSARQDDLLTVVLSDSRVTFVHGKKRVWTHGDLVVVQVNESNEVHGVRLPLMKSRRQEHWLSPVNCKPNEALLHGYNVTVAVLDKPPHGLRLALGVHVEGLDQVHARSSKEVTPLIVAKLQHVTSRNQIFLVEGIVPEETADGKLQAKLDSTPQVFVFRSIRLQEVQITDVVLAIVGDQKAGSCKGFVGWAILELISIQMWVVVGIHVAYEALLQLTVFRHLLRTDTTVNKSLRFKSVFFSASASVSLWWATRCN
mmetsp:Transcript_5556/g.10118  ORF Transcript_5556/g.10118 Transcript_5556/m.10118 type:complete len:359 (+) Transcript_5556:1182-2258(+)